MDMVNTEHRTIEEFKATIKHRMKKIVKEATRKAALEYLLKASEGMSKTKDLSYKELKLQEYLSDEKLNKWQKQLAFKLRTRTAKFENNVGKKITCVICQTPGTCLLYTSPSPRD